MKRYLWSCALSLGAFAPIAAAETEAVRIDIWEQDSPDFDAEMDKWISVYQKQNPNIKIVRQHYENEALRTKYLRSSVTGDGADIVYGPNDIAGVFATAGVIQPVDDLVGGEQIDQTAINVTKLNGKVWGVPISSGNHLVLFYNKKLVNKAPEDFEELIALSKSHIASHKKHYGLAMYQSEPFWFAPFMSAFNAWPLSHKGGKTEITLDTPEAKKALSFLKSLKDEHKILPKDCDYECAKSLFMSEKAPFHINGDWEINNFKSAFGDNLGMVALPLIKETKKHLAPLLGGRYVFINASLKGKKLEETKKFIKFMTDKAVQVRIATELHRIPINKAAREHPLVKKDTVLKDLIATTSFAKPSPSDVEMRAAWDGLRIMVQRAMSGKETVEQAAATGQKAANEALGALKKDPAKSH